MRVGGVELQKKIELPRVEMWCARLYIESREGALEAMAAGDFILYRVLREDEQYWRRALVVMECLGLEVNQKRDPVWEHAG